MHMTSAQANENALDFIRALTLYRTQVRVTFPSGSTFVGVVIEVGVEKGTPCFRIADIKRWFSPCWEICEVVR